MDNLCQWPLRNQGGLPGPSVRFAAIRSWATPTACDADIFYEHYNFRPGDRATVDRFELIYPASEKAKCDAIVARISKSLRPGKGISD